MKSNHLCKACGVSFPKRKKEKFGSQFCSSGCYELEKDKQKSCDPCDLETLRYRIVIFKNGTDHVQEYCTECRKTRFVPREVGIKHGLYEVDFLTETVRMGWGTHEREGYSKPDSNVSQG